jgi:hypothetical protein
MLVCNVPVGDHRNCAGGAATTVIAKVYKVMFHVER